MEDDKSHSHPLIRYDFQLLLRSTLVPIHIQTFQINIKRK